MKLLVNQDIKVLESVLSTIDEVMGDNYKGSTKTYSDIIKHPNEDLFAMPVKEVDIVNMVNNFPAELEQIGSDLVGQLVDYTEDWRPKVDDSI